MEIFVQTEYPDILEIGNMSSENIEDHFGIYGRTEELRKKFKIQPGHLSDLLAFIKFCRDKRETEKLSQQRTSKKSKENQYNSENNQDLERLSEDKHTILKLIENYVSNKAAIEEGTYEWGIEDIEVRENSALVKCILCDRKISIQLRLFKNGYRSWTISNWCNHLSIHTKKRKAGAKNAHFKKRQLTLTESVSPAPLGSVKIMNSEGVLVDYSSFRIQASQETIQEPETEDPSWIPNQDSGENSGEE